MFDSAHSVTDLGDVATWVTAISTIALVLATGALAYLTLLLAKSAHRPFVIATIEPNIWAPQYLDLHIVNEGNASAFDVVISFEPPLPVEDDRRKPGHPDAISILRSGQHLKIDVGQAQMLFDLKSRVTLEWSNKSGGKKERNTYPLDVTYLKTFRMLGREPYIQIAGDIQKIEKSLGKIVSGHSPLKVAIFDRVDREAERKRWEALREEAINERTSSSQKDSTRSVAADDS